ncbi:MAG TPA: glycosyltransferase family 4 protein [Solirubrobacteraceae bacterium]|nr:glycosyltransferase family 4 protein [Solirubrobacteraceae bacterium]
MQASSGTTASLLAALGELVAEAVPLSGALAPRPARAAHLAGVAMRLRPRDLAHLRSAARRAHSAAQLGRPTIAARTMLIRRRVAAAGRLDGVVQRGSEMRLPRGTHLVTLDDSTVLQAWHAYPWPHLQGFSPRDLERYSERQRRIFRSAVACCCATHWVAESIAGDYGIARERVFTVGFGQNHATPAPAQRDWSSPRYLFVGMDWERKNGDAVLAAFARVRERHPDATLDLVGGHPRVEQPGVRGHGELSLLDDADRERMASLYGTATAFVMPSLHEPAGIVYAEAGAAGVPSIGTTSGGAATMIGRGGLVVDPVDGDQLLAAMLTLADPDTARRMGELARSHAALFTWRKVAERVVRAMALPGLDTSGLADFL